ncbi:MAG: Glutamyl-tRNA synthetase @ Glutamyl-tRNA(Gln) synthetase, partial [uncultured Acidimicrobiales bacterium]
DPGDSPGPFFSRADRVPPRRRRPDRPLQLAVRAPRGGHVRPAHRGHRPRPLARRAHRRDPADDALARDRLGRGAPPSVPTGRGLPFGGHPPAGDRQRLLLRLFARRRAGPHEGRLRLRRLVSRPGPDLGSPPVPGAGRGRDRRPRLDPRRRHVRPRHDRGLRHRAHGRHGRVPPGQRGRRHGHGHDPRHPGRGPPGVHAEGAADPGCAGRHAAAPVRPSAPHREREAPEALQAPRRRGGRGVPGARLPPRGHAQLPGPAGLVAGGRPGDRADRGDGGRVPHRGREALARVLRRQEARGHQRRVHPRPPGGHVRQGVTALARDRPAVAAGVLRPRSLRGRRTLRPGAGPHPRRGAVLGRLSVPRGAGRRRGCVGQVDRPVAQCRGVARRRPRCIPRLPLGHRGAPPGDRRPCRPERAQAGQGSGADPGGDHRAVGGPAVVRVLARAGPRAHPDPVATSQGPLVVVVV